MLFSRRFLIKMIIPLILQQALDITIGLIDSIMVASAGEAAVSGVSLIGTLDMLIVYAFTSLATGGAVVVAQAYGENNVTFARHAAKQLLYVATAVAIAVSSATLIFRVPLLNGLFGDVESDVMQNALEYFFYIGLSMPFYAIIRVCSTFFSNMGKTLTPLLLSIGMNLFNIGGNALMIFGFHMGAKGAAVATLLSRALCALIFLILSQSKKHDIRIEKALHYRPDFPVIKQILRIGVPNGVENSMFQFGKLLTQSLISSLGTAVIAGNAVAQTLATFEYMPSSLNSAMTAVVGRCIGAGEKEQAKYYAKKLTFYSYIVLWIFDIGVMLLSGIIIRAYNLSPESADLAYQLILWHSIVGAIIWPIGFSLPNVFRAASDVKFTLYVSAGSMWVFRVALGYVLALETVTVFGFSFAGFGLGAMGVWIAMFIDWVFRSAMFLWRFLSNKWLTKYKSVIGKDKNN